MAAPPYLSLPSHAPEPGQYGDMNFDEAAFTNSTLAEFPSLRWVLSHDQTMAQLSSLSFGKETL